MATTAVPRPMPTPPSQKDDRSVSESFVDEFGPSIGTFLNTYVDDPAFAPEYTSDAPPVPGYLAPSPQLTTPPKTIDLGGGGDGVKKAAVAKESPSPKKLTKSKPKRLSSGTVKRSDSTPPPKTKTTPNGSPAYPAGAVRPASPLSHSPSLLVRPSSSSPSLVPSDGADVAHKRNVSTGTTFSTFSAVDSGYAGSNPRTSALSAIPPSPPLDDSPQRPPSVNRKRTSAGPGIVEPFWEFNPHPSTAALRKMQSIGGVGQSLHDLRRKDSFNSTASLSLRRLRRRNRSAGGALPAGIPERKSSRFSLPATSIGAPVVMQTKEEEIVLEEAGEDGTTCSIPSSSRAGSVKDAPLGEGPMTPGQLAQLDEDEQVREEARRKAEAIFLAERKLSGLGIASDDEQPTTNEAEETAAASPVVNGSASATADKEDGEKTPKAGEANGTAKPNGAVPTPRRSKAGQKRVVGGPTSIRPGTLLRSLPIRLPGRETSSDEDEDESSSSSDDERFRQGLKRPFHPTRPPTQLELKRALACHVVDMDGRAAPFRSLFSAPPTFTPSTTAADELGAKAKAPVSKSTPIPVDNSEAGPVIVMFVRFWNCGYCQEYAKQLSRVFARGTVARRGLEESKARVAIIGTGSWKMMRAWAQVVGWEGGVYTDPTSNRALFKALGMTRNTLAMGKDSEKGDYLEYLGIMKMMRNSTVNAFKMPMKNPGSFVQLGGEFCFATVDAIEKKDPSTLLRLSIQEESMADQADGIEGHFSLTALDTLNPKSSTLSLTSLKRRSNQTAAAASAIASATMADGTPPPSTVPVVESGVRCLYANRMTNSRNHGPFTPLFAVAGIEVPRAAPKAGVVNGDPGSIKRTFKTVL